MKNIILIISILFIALNSTAQSIDDYCGACDDKTPPTGCPGGDLSVDISSEECNYRLDIQGEVYPAGATVTVYKLDPWELICSSIPCTSSSLSPGTHDIQVFVSTDSGFGSGSGCTETTDIPVTIRDNSLSACCSFSDGTCAYMTEYACCVAGGAPAPNETCDNGDGCSTDAESGTCYECTSGQVTMVYSSPEGGCNTSSGYIWTTDTVEVGDACPDDGSEGGIVVCEPIETDTYESTANTVVSSYYIRLMPGFAVPRGSFYHGYIEDCPDSGVPKISNSGIEVEIFPNPNSGTFTFKLDSPLEGMLDMKIFDMTGRVVYEEASSYVLSGKYQKEIQLPASLANGMYNIKVIVGEGQISKRIVIQR